MARIILSEKQFKEYCRRIMNENYVKDSISEILNESSSENKSEKPSKSKK